MLTPFIQLYGSGHVHGLQHNGNALLDFERDALHRETGRTLQGSGDHTLTIRRRWDALGRLQALASQGLQRHITHTVYEPETFTPLVQLSAKASAQARPHALMLAVHGDGGDDEGSAQMAQMLQALPGDMRHLLDRNIRQAAREGLPEHILALMPDQGESALRSARNMRKQLEKQEQSQRTEITVRHYHCDHLGTPLALTDESNQIVWAARLDPWGNVQEEFNPQNISQPIRLPGQHQDKDTGLYYNRHRYYDPSIGSYVNQDPIGLAGGVNTTIFPTNPNGWSDPTGLDATAVRAGNTVTINADIALQGPNATADLAKSWQDSINKIWNAGEWKYGGCKVKINASVKSGGKAKNNINVGAGHGRSFVYGIGGNSGTWFASDLPWVSAHETGHLMGLGDRYKDVAGSSVANKGWESNIMGAFGAPVDQRNIDEIVSKNLGVLDKILCKCWY